MTNMILSSNCFIRKLVVLYNKNTNSSTKIKKDAKWRNDDYAFGDGNKKEQFRGKQKIKSQICKLPIENKGLLKSSDAVNESNGKVANTLNNLLHKIRF